MNGCDEMIMMDTDNAKQITGRIQQIQSFSTLDGPGTRVVVFLQGCPVGCVFCHNPDAWAMEGGVQWDVGALLRRLERFRPFLTTPGLTISGGEPLAQPEFTLALARQARLEGWQVALDTSGWGSGEDLAQILSAVDLVLFSIKHPLAPQRVSRFAAEAVKVKLGYLVDSAKPVWLRYVLIPGWTDEPEALLALAQMAAELPKLVKIEILPYNGLAESKWRQLNWDSPLFHDRPRVSESQLHQAEEMVAGYLRQFQNVRRQN